MIQSSAYKTQKFKEFGVSDKWQNTNYHAFKIYDYILKSNQYIPPNCLISYTVAYNDYKGNNIKYYSFPNENAVMIQLKMPNVLLKKFISVGHIDCYRVYASIKFNSFTLDLITEHSGYIYDKITSHVTYGSLCVKYYLSKGVSIKDWFDHLTPLGGHWTNKKHVKNNKIERG